MSVRLPGLRLKDHRFEVPLDYEHPKKGTIEIFGREVVSAKPGSDQLPWLVFFQGGPGHGSPRPMSSSGWLAAATESFRVFLLDQRGTGRSTPVLAQTMAGMSDEEIAAYLSFFRADSIVHDAEFIRRKLAGNDRWTGLGQSYGGFCLTQYLSQAPEGLAAVLITGGIPPVFRNAEDVYRATFTRLEDRNRRYFERYPEDAELLQRIARKLRAGDVSLPGGSSLSVRMLQQLGLAFGMSDGFETVHYILENAFVEVSGEEELSFRFLRNVESQLDFEVCPIFAILHESIYAQGDATQWAAQRVRRERPEFCPDRTDQLYFTGEMIFSWMFEEYKELRFLGGAAEKLAQKADWPQLYDIDRLAKNDVPIAAISYDDDMYVERRFSEETASRVPQMKVWYTNEYDHNGLRADGDRIFRKLLAMTRDQG
jgi:pimeloyl-ACP methyl ester carboxylesterase